MDEKLDQNKCYKIKLKSILNKKTDHEKHLNRINEIVLNFNKLISDTYDFIKLYYLFQYESNNSLPKIDKKFVYSIMKTLGTFDKEQNSINDEKQDKIKKKDKIKKFKTDLNKSLYDFYINCYNKNLNHTKINISKADNLLKYSSITISTMITNNIKQRFI